MLSIRALSLESRISLTIVLWNYPVKNNKRPDTISKQKKKSIASFYHKNGGDRG